MSTAPYVELGFHPTDLRPRDLPSAGTYLGSPAEALEAAFSVVRAQMIAQMRDETRGLSDPTHSQLLRIADLAWQGAFYRFRKVSAPIIADAYMHAYQSANAGDVPMSLIYDLAEKHAEKVGDYFHITSREGLADGFNTLVNRRIPAKAAVDRVLDAYGLTPRQMRAYTSAKQFETPVSDRLPRSLKAKAREYVDRAFTSRIKKMSDQEEHNINEQAKQFAWMWLHERGRLNEKAQKLWITAKDERVCEVCGPLHGKKVGVNERFRTSQGEFWTPGLHPNCRCVVRLLEHRFSKNAFGLVTKSDSDWNPKEHPRGGDPKNRGRFSALARNAPFKEPDEPVIETTEPTADIWESLTEAPAPVEEEKLSMVPTEQEGKLSMGGNRKLSMGQLSMKGTLSMGGQKLSMTGQSDAKKLSMTPAEREAKLSQLTTPQMQMAMDRTVLSMLMAPRPTTPPRKLTRYERPTIHIQDDQGHEYPVYAVVEPDQLNWNGSKLELDHTVQFSPSQSVIVASANEKFIELIRDRSDAIYNDPALTRLKYTDRSGREWTADLDDAEILEVVNWTAYQGRVVDPSTALGYNMSLEYSDAGGNRTSRAVPIHQVASSLGVKPSDFDVRILRMDEGHDSQDGTTVMDQAGTKHGYENWVTSGVYNANTYRSEEIGHNLAVKMYWIDPDVLEIEKPFD